MFGMLCAAACTALLMRRKRSRNNKSLLSSEPDNNVNTPMLSVDEQRASSFNRKKLFPPARRDGYQHRPSPHNGSPRSSDEANSSPKRWGNTSYDSESSEDNVAGVPPEFVIPFKLLQMGTPLGGGASGMVISAKYHGASVAVKAMFGDTRPDSLTSEEQDDITQEIRILVTLAL
jgi:hypothetical protein